ncbi:unnamed protein product [Microthlaspi erraticum]|uniref:MBD domain-containing protein n=1 Tax=Microthlaspi erraticum TaxID=1685480 RepID=A0A6D2KJR7_9BRAS|nr:unnamed protein product [Microthlaspi erraticum]
MDGGNPGNSNNNLEGGSGDRLSAESLPLIDLRLLSQSDLRALSNCSSLSPSSSASLAASAGGDDDLTPKIDRSVFNESAGSRKQTFQRLRLARHPPPPGPPSPQRRRDDSSSEEKSQVASVLRSLFSVDSIETKAEEDEGAEENEGQRLFPAPIHNNGNVYRNPYFDSIKNLLAQGISDNETKRKRGRPRKIQNPSDELINEETDVFDDSLTESRYDDSGISMDSNSGKRKRGRPPRIRDGFNREEPVSLENREGTMVDLTALAHSAEDPYGEELRRVTVGLETKEGLLGFLEQMNGEWVNTGKKKKVVKACDFGGYLPRGWRLMLCIKRKGNNQWLACHRYISPGGMEFATCKEVSTYLQSLVESQSKNQLNPMLSDNKTVEQPVIANESLPLRNLESNKSSSDVFEEAKGKDDKGIPTAEFMNGDDEADDVKKKDDNMEQNCFPHF